MQSRLPKVRITTTRVGTRRPSELVLTTTGRCSTRLFACFRLYLLFHSPICLHSEQPFMVACLSVSSSSSPSVYCQWCLEKLGLIYSVKTININSEEAHINNRACSLYLCSVRIAAREGEWFSLSLSRCLYGTLQFSFSSTCLSCRGLQPLPNTVNSSAWQHRLMAATILALSLSLPFLSRPRHNRERQSTREAN